MNSNKFTIKKLKYTGIVLCALIILLSYKFIFWNMGKLIKTAKVCQIQNKTKKPIKITIWKGNKIVYDNEHKFNINGNYIIKHLLSNDNESLRVKMGNRWYRRPEIYRLKGFVVLAGDGLRIFCFYSPQGFRKAMFFKENFHCVISKVISFPFILTL